MMVAHRSHDYGYARVATDAQALGYQVARLKAAGCANIDRAKISGATADRPQLKKLIAAIGSNDLAGSTCDLLNTPAAITDSSRLSIAW